MPKSNRSRASRLAILITLAGFAVATQANSGCASSSSSSTTGTSSAAPAGVNGTEGSSASKPHAHVQVFHGVGQKDLGTIVVPVSSTVSWTCESCTNANFQISNASSDSGLFPTNGLDQTHGVDPLEAGTYHTVVVNTEARGSWTVRIVPGE